MNKKTLIKNKKNKRRCAMFEVLTRFEQVIRDLGVEFKITEKGQDRYEVKFDHYIFFVSSPYSARLAIFGLLNCGQELLESGYVEKMINWSYDDYDLWDPERIFDEKSYVIFTSKVQDAIIKLEMKIIFAPLSRVENSKFKVYIKGFVECYIPPV
jgi:hypothetical protein